MNIYVAILDNFLEPIGVYIDSIHLDYGVATGYVNNYYLTNYAYNRIVLFQVNLPNPGDFVTTEQILLDGTPILARTFN